MVSISEIGDMIKACNVKGLSSIFQRTGDWDTRETIAVALRNMVWEKHDFDRTEMIDTLENIEVVCKTETGGGTYKTNCLNITKDLLCEMQSTGQSQEATEKKSEEIKVVSRDVNKKNQQKSFSKSGLIASIILIIVGIIASVVVKPTLLGFPWICGGAALLFRSFRPPMRWIHAIATPIGGILVGKAISSIYPLMMGSIEYIFYTIIYLIFAVILLRVGFKLAEEPIVYRYYAQVGILLFILDFVIRWIFAEHDFLGFIQQARYTTFDAFCDGIFLVGIVLIFIGVFKKTPK